LWVFSRLFLQGILIFKVPTERRLYTSFGFKGLTSAQHNSVGDGLGSIRNVGVSNTAVLLYAVKAHYGVEIWLHSFLASALGGGEWLASGFGRFNQEEIDLVIYGIGSYLCSRASVEHKGKDKGHPITGHEGPRGGVEV
jgi:hypothetical protein